MTGFEKDRGVSPTVYSRPVIGSSAEWSTNQTLTTPG